MTAYDLDQPRMIYMGPLPPHLLRPEEPVEAHEDAPHDPADEPLRVPMVGTAVAAGVALAVGVAIGAFVPALLHAGHGRPAMATPSLRPAIVAKAEIPQVAPEPAPEPSAVAPAPVPPPAPIPAATPAVEPPRAAPLRAALAMLVSPASAEAHALPPAVRKPAAGSPCTAGSRADLTVCADPEVATADRELKTASQRALRAGNPASTVAGDQIAWLLTREDAARRSPAELASVYRQRIDRMNSLADEPPH